jgi:hypothetical protein
MLADRRSFAVVLSNSAISSGRSVQCETVMASLFVACRVAGWDSL